MASQLLALYCFYRNICNGVRQEGDDSEKLEKLWAITLFELVLRKNQECGHVK